MGLQKWRGTNMFDDMNVFEYVIEQPMPEAYCIIQAICDEKYRDTLQKVVENISLTTYIETRQEKLYERFK